MALKICLKTDSLYFLIAKVCFVFVLTPEHNRFVCSKNVYFSKSEENN